VLGFTPSGESIAAQPEESAVGFSPLRIVRRSLHRGEFENVDGHQQIQDQIFISPIILLPPSRQLPDLGRISYQQLMAYFFHHLFKPVRVPTSLDPHNHFTAELTVESSDVIALMVQFPLLDASIFSVQVTHRLLGRVDVYSYV